LKPNHNYDSFLVMTMSLEQVLKETRNMPRKQVAELIGRLTLELQETADSHVEKLWRQETQRRIAEVRNNSVQSIPEEVVSTHIKSSHQLLKPLLFHPAAAEEYLQATAYYAQIDRQLAKRLHAEINRLIQDIETTPNRFNQFEPPAQRHLQTFSLMLLSI
jgi:hypothetical protein